MKELFTLLCDCLEKGRLVALASVIEFRGSTPRGAGSKLLADANGLVAGTIGGGLIEGEALAACRAALRDGKGRILDFELTGVFAAKNEMICGGELRILIEPLLPDAGHLLFFMAVQDALATGEAELITNISDPAFPLRTAFIGNKQYGAPLPEETRQKLLAALGPNREAIVQAHENQVYVIEVCMPPLGMIIAGGGHVSRPTAQVAALAGFEVTVLDDRPEFSQPDRFPWAARILTVPDYQDCFLVCEPTTRTSIVIVTRGHLHDATVLSQALTTRAGYIGMIGSKRKRAEIYASLRAEGVSEEELCRVHCPIGLDIGAESPEEIAVSIVAECIAHRKKS